MPELPDITVYIDALRARVLGRTLRAIRRNSPFLLRTAVPPIDDAVGRDIREIRRIGKRIALATQDGPWLVLHLMIAGRLHWRDPGVALKGKNALAAFDFDEGGLVLTEAGSKRRASLHVLDDDGLAAIDPGGLEVLGAEAAAFAERLTRNNHTLKRALTDPRLLSGIGNAYSDEILHRAGLSPVTLTQKLSPDEIDRLRKACEEVLAEWTERLRAEADGGFPQKVTAFRPEMAVHGKFGQPCPVCDTAVQRIRYAKNETNYCPRCQTGGRVLADRALSRLLKKDWPRTIEELEERRGG